jgi:alcohol dehydrogenase, propanol-preferring
MRAQLLTAIGQPLAAGDAAAPRPGPGQVLIRVSACAVCRTDLHIVDGELPEPEAAADPRPRDRRHDGRKGHRC